jgi:hypothetical protein
MPNMKQTILNKDSCRDKESKVLKVWSYKEWAMKQGESRPGFKGAITTSGNTSQQRDISLEMAQLIGPRCDHAR